MNEYYGNYDRGNSMSFSSSFAALMNKVYAWMALGLIMTALTAMYVASNEEIVRAIFSNSIAFWGLMIGELGLVVWLSAGIQRMSFGMAGVLFAVYSILNGVTLSFIFLIFTAESIAQTFFVTAGTFGAMSLVGAFIKKDLSVLGRVLMMGLIGLIIATVVNMFVHSSGLTMMLNYLGVLIFVGLTAYDTQKIKQMLAQAGAYGVTPETNKLALIGSLQLYLDFVNLFLYLLRFFGNRK